MQGGEDPDGQGSGTGFAMVAGGRAGRLSWKSLGIRCHDSRLFALLEHTAEMHQHVETGDLKGTLVIQVSLAKIA